MDKERVKEIRSWTNLIMTIIVCPVVYALIQGQRLQIEKEISDGFVAKTVYSEDKTRNEQERRDMQQSIGALQGKLDSVFIEQVHINDSLSMMKERNYTK